MSAGVQLRGEPIAKAIREEVAARLQAFRDWTAAPRIDVIVASKDPAVLSYAASKQRIAERLGVSLNVVELDTPTQAALNAAVERSSADPAVHGVILELPVADGLSARDALALLRHTKDLDGLTPHNLGLLLMGDESGLRPATPQACIALAETGGSLAGKRVCLVGRGATVGRPLAAMLINRRSTITVCHTATRDLDAELKRADVIIVAAGRPALIRPDMVGTGQTIIDAGINVVEGRLVGDVDPSVSDVAAALTPVPGGVGPLTTAYLFRNLVTAIELQHRARPNVD